MNSDGKIPIEEPKEPEPLTVRGPGHIGDIGRYHENGAKKGSKKETDSGS